MCTTSDTLAKQGFRVVCPDIYRGKLAKDFEEAGHLRNGLDWDGACADISAAGVWLKS
jgi:carboxymethylenebutenolidase